MISEVDIKDWIKYEIKEISIEIDKYSKTIQDEDIRARLQSFQNRLNSLLKVNL
jgi:hypothetical protein